MRVSSIARLMSSRAARCFMRFLVDAPTRRLSWTICSCLAPVSLFWVRPFQRQQTGKMDRQSKADRRLRFLRARRFRVLRLGLHLCVHFREQRFHQTLDLIVAAPRSHVGLGQVRRRPVGARRSGELSASGRWIRARSCCLADGSVEPRETGCGRIAEHPTDICGKLRHFSRCVSCMTGKIKLPAHRAEEASPIGDSDRQRNPAENRAQSQWRRPDPLSIQCSPALANGHDQCANAFPVRRKALRVPSRFVDGPRHCRHEDRMTAEPCVHVYDPRDAQTRTAKERNEVISAGLDRRRLLTDLDIADHARFQTSRSTRKS